MIKKNNSTRDELLIKLVVVLLFLSPLVYVGILQDPSTLPRYALLAAIVSIAIILFSYFLFSHDNKIYYTPVIFIAVVYLGLAAVSAQWAVEPSNNLVYIMQLTSLVLLFLIVTQISTYTAIHLFLYASVFAAGLSALIGIAQNYGFNIFDLRGPRMGGTFGYKNHAALYFDLIIPVGFIMTLVSENKYLKWFSALALMLCLMYIVTSHTRGSFVALFAVFVLFILIVLVFKDVRKITCHLIMKNKLIIVALLISVISSSFITGKTDEVLNRPAYKNDKIDTSTRDRLTAYSNSLYLIKNKPLLGNGYGTFWKAFRPYNNHPVIMPRSDENLVMYRLHNDFLQIVIELGVIGGLLFLSIFIWTYVIGLKLLSLNISSTGKLLVTGMLLGLSASLVHSLVDFPFLKPSSATQIWLYAGLINGLYATYYNKNFIITSLLLKILISLASLSLAMVFFIFFKSFMLGNYYLHRAENSYNNQRCDESTRYVDKAVNQFRFDFFSHKMRVNLHIACTKNNAILYKVLSEELRWDDTNTMALKWRGYLYLNAGNLNKANEDFKKLSYLLPHRVSGYIGEAYVLLESGELEKAMSIVNKLLVTYPDDNDVEKAVNRIKAYKARVTQ